MGVYDINTVDGVIEEIKRLIKQYEKAKKRQEGIDAPVMAASFQGSIISLEVLFCNICGESYCEYLKEKNNF